jgi:penicillin-binding protein 1C
MAKESKIWEHRMVQKYWWIIIPLVILVGLVYWFILRDLPSPTKLTGEDNPQATRLYDRNGELLFTLYANKKKTYVPLADISLTVHQATISIEDRDFYHHGALDFRGIARAFIATVFHGNTQGGSTITQQLVKTTLLTPEQTITRKLREAVLAIATELLYSKDKILELYLNEVPYGGTAYGIEAASQTYFGKPAKELELHEAALLAALPESPSVYSPLIGSRPDLGKARQLQVLQAMREEGYITVEQEKEAGEKELVYQRAFDPIKAPHFVFYVRDLLVAKYGREAVEEGGLIVRTSLDLATQSAVQNIVKTEVERLERGGFRVSNGAVLVTKPGTGEIIAMIGSRDPAGKILPAGCTPGRDCTFEPSVNVTRAKRQPGSSIKPLTYAVGIASGYSAATPFIDGPMCVDEPDGKKHCFRNYDGTFSGVVTMRDALARSLNIPAVKMLKLNGLQATIASASSMGITTFNDPRGYGLSLTLGGGEVTMLDMAVAFGVFANSGYRIDVHPILSVTDKTGKVLESYTPPASPIFGRKVLPAGVAFIISDILADNNARTPAFGPRSALVIPGKTVSVKTGTTSDYKDNWTIGYTPSYLVAAWVGNNDNSPMGGIASGVTGAAPIWNEIMTYLLKDRPNEPLARPPDVVQRAFCRFTGELSTPANPCPSYNEYAITGIPLNTAKISREAVWVDKTTQTLPSPGQTDNLEPKEQTILTDVTGERYCVTCPNPFPTPSSQPVQ